MQNLLHIMIPLHTFDTQVVDSWIGKIIQGMMQEQVYPQIFLNCPLAALLHET